MSAAAGVVLSSVREDIMHSPGCFDNRVGLHLSESILIYLTLTGSVIPMRILESDSIASVKLRIQTCKGFVVKRQKLVFGGRELARNECLVRDYGVTGGNVLHLVLKLSDLLVINVRTVCGKEFELQVDRHRNVGYLKHQILKEGKGSVDFEDQEIFCSGEKLDDQSLIDDICEDNDAVIHLLVKKSAKVRAKPVEKDVELSVVVSNFNERKDGVDEADKSSDECQVLSTKQPKRDFLLAPIVVNPKIKLPSVIWDVIKSTFDGLENGNQPIRSSEGTGGAYLMQDHSGQKYVSVFKPVDEEPMAVNNPRGLPVSLDGEGLKKGTRVGEGALREVAAYVLDHPKSGPRFLTGEVTGFSGVPPTTMVRCLHEGFNHPRGYECAQKNVKIGSLQMFVENDGNCEDMGPQAFPVEEVHKISVLDIRLANADRHGGNLLLRRKSREGQISLIPIDHGYCLPENFEDITFDWLYWPQAREQYSPDTINYIRSLDAEKDIALLKVYGWDLSVECAQTLHISTMLLKKGAERCLTPYTIGSIMCRVTLNDESMIQEMVREARERLLPGVSEAAFLETISQVMDAHLDKLTK
ncbi:Phosphatidylinositol 4-kinase gamma 4 [Ancistrocladus abbreviatus]